MDGGEMDCSDNFCNFNFLLLLNASAILNECSERESERECILRQLLTLLSDVNMSSKNSGYFLEDSDY